MFNRAVHARTAPRRLLARGVVIATMVAAVTIPAASAGAASIAFGNVIAYTFVNQQQGRTVQIRIVNADTGHQYGLLQGSTPAWSPDGSRLAFIDTTDKIVIRNADGSLLHTGVATFGLEIFTGAAMRWSPDGKHLAYAGDDFIRVMNTQAPYNPHTVGPALAHDPSWSPDGKRIPYLNDADTNLHIMNIDGSNDVQIPGTTLALQPAWSPDGTEIAFYSAGQVSVVAPDGTGRRVVDPLSGLVESQLTWSPSSTQIAYTHVEQTDPYTEISQLLVVNADGSNLHALIPDASPALQQPAWRP